MEKQNRLEKELNNPFEKLKENIGKKVLVTYIQYGSFNSELSILKNVSDYSYIEFGDSSTPFIGYGSAIQLIADEKGNILYKNLHIQDDYDIRDSQQRENLVAKTFGKNVALKIKKDRIKSEKEWEKQKRESNKFARTKTNNYLEQGKILIKENILNEWNDYAKKNTQDAYSAGVIDASLRVMKALSKGKTPKKAEKAIYGMDITGFMAGCIAQTVSYFHPRGEEFRQYWNKQYMNEEDAEKTKGIVNPAILTLRE